MNSKSLSKSESVISIILITISVYTLNIISAILIADNQRNFADSDLESGMIQIDLDWIIGLDKSDFGLIQVHADWKFGSDKSEINFHKLIVYVNYFTIICIYNFKKSREISRISVD